MTGNQITPARDQN